MKRLSSVATIVSIALATGVYGCKSDDENSPPTSEEADDVSATTANLVASNDGQGGEVRAMADAVALIKGETPDGMSLSAEGAFQFNRAGLRYSYKVSCVDARGGSVTCGPEADGGTLTVNWDGNYQGLWITGSAQRAGEWTLRDVRSNNPVLSGTGSFDLSIDYDSLDGRRQSSYDLAYDATYSDVRFDRTAGRPVDGTIRYEVDATRTTSGPKRDANAEFQATAVVTFSATGASLTVSGDHNYDINLKTGEATRKGAR
jgi:hypothetical protein